MLASVLITRRSFVSTIAGATGAIGAARLEQQQARADYTIEIAPYRLQVSRRTTIETIAYNSQVPGPLIRLQQGKPVTIEVENHTKIDEVVHWHGLFLPSQIDGAMEEGTPAIPAGHSARYTFTPKPAGFRWFHTHTFAGHDLKRGQYTGQHGFLLIEAAENPGRYDAEFFLALHDWRGQFLASNDGSMNPSYDISTINGRVLGFGEPLRVKSGQRVLVNVLNSSPTEVHWIAFTGHEFEVVALDGNTVPVPRKVTMLRVAPAERVSALVQMNNPGVWILGEVRKHVQTAGMGVVVEYAGQSGKPRWNQPETLDWDYAHFGHDDENETESRYVNEIPLVFKSKFAGHGELDHWTINGQSFPHTETPVLHEGQRYRLLFKNESMDAHPVHLHRHLFELRRFPGRLTRGILKDTVLVPVNEEVHVEFTANDPGMTLFHCHQQDHMDMGFMMLFRYA